MKKLIWIVLENKVTLKLLVRFFAWLNTMSYFIVSRLSVKLEKGLHPKHQIIKYEQWFQNKISNSDVILDIGSHEGVLVMHLSNVAKSVVGVEINEKSYNRAKEKIKQANVKFLLGDATTMSLSDEEPFSVVTLSNVLEHIEDRKSFLKKVISNINWKGSPRVLIRVPSRERDWLTIYKKKLDVEWRLDKTHFTEHTLEELQDEISSAGMKIIDTRWAFGEIFIECVGTN